MLLRQSIENKGIDKLGSGDYDVSISDPAVIGKIAKWLIMKNLQLLHCSGRPVSINDPAVVE